MTLRGMLLLGCVLTLPLAAVAQPAKTAAKPKTVIRPPDDKQRKEIDDKLGKLTKAIDDLRAKKLDDAILVEVEVYAKAVEWITRHNEFFDDQAKATVAVVDQGLDRAKHAADAPWRKTGTTTARAYRSKVDGSVQPYAVTTPPNYGRDPATNWRLDVVLHGRNEKLTEVSFLNGNKTKPAKDAEYVRIDVFGRTNNAYRWAGEADVFEAMQSFLAEEARAGRTLIDPRRVVLHGFSMGGAGVWHLGLHHPAMWAVIGPGAGFSDTKSKTKLPDPLPEHIERCLRIYDAVEYAENAATVPVVAYGGEKDPQLLAAQLVEKRLKPLGIPMVLFVAPNTEHKLIPEYEAKMQAEYHKHAGPGSGRRANPDEVRFATYTLKFNKCDWVSLHGLGRHYDRASVVAKRTADGIDAKTENVTRMELALPGKSPSPLRVSVDGQALSVEPHNDAVLLERAGGTWKGVTAFAGNRKVPGLQGPIDDAFASGFLCVRGTGKPWHPAVHAFAMANLERFRREWDKYLRGKLPITDDTAVTADDIKTKHLILFGDPGSHALMAKLMTNVDSLTWTRDALSLDGTKADAATTMPVAIAPNPASGKYVVLNSGHTFHEDAFKGTNALLYPRLGDYALLKIAATAKDPLACDVVTVGLFDEEWKVRK